MDTTKVTKDIENKRLTIERIFHAPKEKLWKAYADKAWFEKWWGPEGWETTAKEHDFKVGGRIHYGMKCVDKAQGEYYGQESWGLMTITSLEVNRSFAAEDRFADAAGNIDESMPAQRFEVELKEEDGKTTLTSHSFCNTAEELEQLVKMGMVEGFSSQLNKLESLLA